MTEWRGGEEGRRRGEAALKLSNRSVECRPAARFVSGHGFSHAVAKGQAIGFSRCKQAVVARWKELHRSITVAAPFRRERCFLF